MKNQNKQKYNSLRYWDVVPAILFSIIIVFAYYDCSENSGLTHPKPTFLILSKKKQNRILKKMKIGKHENPGNGATTTWSKAKNK